LKGVYLALSARLIVNLESLNMAESVGNITKHRRAPVVMETGQGYRIVYVPVISGMSLAHHYQHILARAAYERGLQVTRMSLEGYFLKFANDDIIRNYYPEVEDKVNKSDLCGTEKTIVEADVVADIGGFLYTNGPVKRTSRFSFSYMMPALDAINATAVQPQLHVRYTPKPERREQALIYVDNASAVYTMSFILEASEVSILNVCKALGQEPFDLGTEERVKRVEAALEALIAMLGNMVFGAKRSRSLPQWKVESVVAVASTGITPFTPSPGHSRSYLADTVKRLEAQLDMINGMEAEVHYYDATGKLESPEKAKVTVTDHSSLEEVLKAAGSWVLGKLKQQS